MQCTLTWYWQLGFWHVMCLQPLFFSMNTLQLGQRLKLSDMTFTDAFSVTEEVIVRHVDTLLTRAEKHSVGFNEQVHPRLEKQ